MTTLSDDEIGYKVSMLPKHIEVTYTHESIDSAPGLLLMCRCGLSISTFVPVSDRKTIDLWAAMHVPHDQPAKSPSESPVDSSSEVDDSSSGVDVEMFARKYSIAQLHALTVDIAKSLYIELLVRHAYEAFSTDAAESCVNAAIAFVAACTRSGLADTVSEGKAST